ncbi:MAG: hypothetical protein AAGC55_24485 [Myxococcota bacterium]
MSTGTSKWVWIGGGVAVLGAAAVYLLVAGPGDDRATASGPPNTERAAEQAHQSGTAATARPRVESPAMPMTHSGDEPGSADDLRGNEYIVDLAALRREMPENLYWKVSAPTDDPDTLTARAADKQRWNTLYGKVLSGTASEDEVRAYYDYRKRLSTDHLAFARRVLERYGPDLPERDRGLYQLSIDMHTTRLDEIPRQISEAMERMREQERRREAWRSGQ